MEVGTTTKDELKRKLKASWAISAQINELHIQLQELRVTGTRITPSYSIEAAGGGDNNTSKPEQAALAIYELEQEINSKIEQQCKTLGETYALIDLLDDELLKLLMLMHYVGRKPWEQIAAELHYSWQWVHELHSRALNAILKRLEGNRINPVL